MEFLWRGETPTKTVRISSTLELKKELNIVTFLRGNEDVFAWEPADMPDIPREVDEHSLNVIPDSR